MKTYIATFNQVKVKAFLQIIPHYPHIITDGSTILEVASESGVSEQPRSLEETVLGAENRATAAARFGGDPVRDMGVGIESGLMDIGARMVNVCACAIHLENKIRGFGISPGFEIPPRMAALVRQGLTIREASLEVGFTENPNIAHEEGNVGILTGGRVTRTEYTKLAIMFAFIQLENSKWY